MTTPIYVFIATKTTYETVIPPVSGSQATFNRRVANAFSANKGGQIIVGDLRFRPTEEAIANHLYCDGTTVDIASFPQLYEYLGTTFGGDGVTTFALPNYTDDVLAVPSSGVTQVVDAGGTVSTGGTTTSPTEPGQAGGTVGSNPVSGGRPQTIRGESEQEV